MGAEGEQEGGDNDAESFDAFLEKEGIHFVKFYAPW